MYILNVIIIFFCYLDISRDIKHLFGERLRHSTYRAKHPEATRSRKGGKEGQRTSVTPRDPSFYDKDGKQVAHADTSADIKFKKTYRTDHQVRLFKSLHLFFLFFTVLHYDIFFRRT